MSTLSNRSGPVNRLLATAKDETVLTSRSAASVTAQDLIVQAKRVRDSLRTTLSTVTTLITAARQQRCQSRLMKTTLASLKQLQQLEA